MSTVLPRYSFCVWLFTLLGFSRARFVFGAVVSVSMVLVVSLVSLVRGQAPGPMLIPASGSIRTASALPKEVAVAENPVANAAALAAPVAEKTVAPVKKAATITPIDRCAAALAEAGRVLESVNAMQAVMEKRERVKGNLEPAQRIELKVRRSPRSVYMRWQSPDEGQEVIWQENAHGNRILVHPGGWRGRLMPMVKVDPKSTRVSEQSRRPIESAGVWAMTRQLSDLVTRVQQSPAGVQVEIFEGKNFVGRSCTVFRLVRNAYQAGADFQSVVFYIDAAAKVPVGMEHYLWGAGGRGQPVLDEYYAYRDLRLNAPLSDRDFDVANPAYHFSESDIKGDARSIGSKAGPRIK